MRGEHHKVARAYVLYRDERARERTAARLAIVHSTAAALQVKQADGTLVALDDARLTRIVEDACAGLSDVAAGPVLAEARRNLYDGIMPDELALAPIMAARTLIEKEPNYAYVSARLLLDKLRAEALSFVHGRPEQATQAEMAERYTEYFSTYIATGIKAELLDPELARFGGALPGPLVAVEHVGAGDLVVLAAHQSQLDLVLDVLDVEGSARIATPRERGDHLAGKLLDHLVHAA
jgi:ribonucleoside-diphosphate reductase alpha chain